MEAFKSLGAKPVPSHANFVCADIGRPVQPVFEAILRGGVIVRSGHVLGLPTYLRVTVGTEQETTRFIEELGTAMKAEVKS